MSQTSFRSLVLPLFLGSALVLPGSQSASAQCSLGWQHELPPNNFNGSVYALTVWDPDGPGGNEPLLFAGGDFTNAGSSGAAHIAFWNSTGWHPVGVGLDGTVRDLAVYHNEVVAVGDFIHAGSLHVSHIAVWNGTDWYALGTGFPEVSSPAWLTVFQDDLIVGGVFGAVGNTNASYVALWNGGDWSEMANGVYPGVQGMGTYNGQLVIASSPNIANPTNLWTWNNGAWVATAAPGVNGNIYSMIQDGNDLVVTGNFTTAGGLPASKIAKWNPTGGWRTFGSGLTGITGNALLHYAGKLVVAGQFTQAGGIAAPCVAAWDSASSTWSAFGTPPSNTIGTHVFRAANLGSQLIVAGTLFYINDNTGMARWTDSCPCPADLDNGSGTGTPDGGVDINDLLFFLSAFEAGSTAADLDNGSGAGTPDGGVDINDLLFFLIHFEAGC